MAPDRIPTPEQRLGEFLDDLDILQGDLAVARKWFDEHWSAELPAPKFQSIGLPDGVLVSIAVHCRSQADWDACGEALQADGCDVAEYHHPPGPGSTATWGIYQSAPVHESESQAVCS